MELYATIFMIFVSNVLSSSTAPYSSRQQGSHAKVRRIPIVYFQNQDSDDESIPEKDVGYIVPFLDEYRERRSINRERTSNTEDKQMADISKSIIPRSSSNSNTEKNGASGVGNGAKRKNKSWISSGNKDNTRKLLDIIPNSNHLNLNQDNKVQRIIDSIPRGDTKTRYISTAENNFESTVKKTTPWKTSIFLPFLKVTINKGGMGWLFFTHPTTTPKNTSKFKYVSNTGTIHALHGVTTNKIDQYGPSRCISKSSAGNVIQADGKYGPKKRNNRDSSNILSSHLEINYHPKTTMLKSGELNVMKKKQQKKKRSVHADFFSLAQCGGKLNETYNGVPLCQRARFYNLTALLNARTMRPAEYYKKRGPALVLNCPSKEMPNAVNEVNALKQVYSLEASSRSPNTQKTTDTAIITAGSLDNKNITSPAQYKITIKDNDATSTARSVNSTTMEQVILKLLMRYKDDLKGSFIYPKSRLKRFQRPLTDVLVYKGKEAYNESPVIGYVMKRRPRKVPKPWDKACPNAILDSSACAKTVDVNRLPWVSTCCVMQTKLGSKLRIKTGTEASKSYGILTTPQVHHSTTIIGPSFHYTNAVLDKTLTTLAPDIKWLQAEKEDISNILEGKVGNKGNLMALVRVPASLTKKYTNSKKLNFVLPNENTFLRKYIKQRSIFDHLFSFKNNKTTLSPRDKISSAYGPPQDKQPKFDLFRSRAKFNDATVSRNKENLSQRKAATNTAFLNLEQLSYDCPVCGKRKDDMITKSKKEEVFAANILNSRNPWNDHCDFVELSPESELENSTLMYQCPNKFKPLKLIQGFKNDPKYYIEVPDSLLNAIENIARIDEVLSTFPTKMKKTQSPELVRSSKPETLLFKHSANENPVVLHLQPFQVNGQNVYLPVQGYGNHVAKTSTTPSDEEYDDYLEITEDSTTSKTQIVDKLPSIDKTLPFALIPAYLTFHPKKGLSFEMDVLPKQLDIGLTDNRNNGTTVNINGKTSENENIITTAKNPSETTQKSDSKTTEECVICTDFEPTMTQAVFKSKTKDSYNRLKTNTVSIENKWLRLAQQIENTLRNPTTAAKRVTSKRRTNVSKKAIRKSVSDMMAKVPHDKKTYILVVKEPGDISRFVPQAHKSIEYKIDLKEKGDQQEGNPLSMLSRNNIKYIL